MESDKKQINYSSIKADEVIKQLQSNLSTGLSDEAGALRLKRYGEKKSLIHYCITWTLKTESSFSRTTVYGIY